MTTGRVGLTLETLVLTADRTPGVDWGLEDIPGWEEGPELQVQTSQRIVSHGQFSQPGHATGRSITVNGFVDTPDRVARMAAAAEITATLADGGAGILEVEDADAGTLWAPVQRVGRPQFDFEHPTIFYFQLQLLAADSYRYGSTSSASTGFASTPEGSGMVWSAFPDGVADFGVQGDTGTVTVSNPGSASASVRFVVTGPTPGDGFVITDASTGEPITYLGAVPEGSTLVLDGSDGSVVIDGTADRLGDTIVTAWPSIPPGMSRDFLFSPLGGATASVLTAEVVASYW